MNVKLQNAIGFVILVFSFFSCQQLVPNQKLNMEVVEFEEFNHVNVHLIDTEIKVLKSQDDINQIYKKINEKNESPRKNPIPSYSEDDTYIVVQPKIKQSDFTVVEVLENQQDLQVKIEERNNEEFKNEKYPASVIRINKKNIYKNIKLSK